MSSYQPLLARPESAGKRYSLAEHLADVQHNGRRILAEITKNSKIGSRSSIFSETDFLTLCSIICASHDLGKASRYFQDYVGPGRVNTGLLKSHSPLSSLYAFFAGKEALSRGSNSNILSTLAVMCALAHHGKLVSPGRTAIRVRSLAPVMSDQIASIDEAHLSELDRICRTLGLPAFSEFKKQFSVLARDFVRLQGTQSYSTKDLEQFYSVATLFSSLIDADRLSAAELDMPHRSLISFDDVKVDVSKIQEEGRLHADSRIIDLREALFDVVMNKADQFPLDRRILSLTAPTGAGKTVAALCFALRVRDRLRGQGIEARIIYVAPFLSIIDQNLDVFKRALGKAADRSDIILAHHHLCEIAYRDQDAEYSTANSLLLVEGWHSEIVVTTLVQFAYTILGRGSKELRKFHNLAGSIVILDEVQSIPVEYWQLIRHALTCLTACLGMTLILMTATQPLIFSKEEVTEIVDDLGLISIPERCLLDVSAFELDLNGQNRKMAIGEFADSILGQANRSESRQNILIVMNTISSASLLFDKLKGKLENHDCQYLSAEVVPKERRERIVSIKKQIDESRFGPPSSKPVILVTTQLVEAGVDIDFDMVFRDLAPIDSIVQCAGRCNRNGLRKREECKLVVVELVDVAGKSFSRRIYGNVSIEKTKEILSSSGGNSFRELSDLYYRKLDVVRNRTYEKNILNGICSLNYDVLDDFKIIEETPGGSVFVELDDKAALVYQKYAEIWRKDTKERGQKMREFLKIRSDFYQYVINVSEPYLAQLGDAAYGIYYIPKSELGQKYDEKKGFVRTPTGII